MRRSFCDILFMFFWIKYQPKQDALTQKMRRKLKNFRRTIFLISTFVRVFRSVQSNRRRSSLKP